MSRSSSPTRSLRASCWSIASANARFTKNHGLIVRYSLVIIRTCNGALSDTALAAGNRDNLFHMWNRSFLDGATATRNGWRWTWTSGQTLRVSEENEGG